MIDTAAAEKAKIVFDTLCACIEMRNWSFDKDEDRLLVHFVVSGDDLPMRFIMIVDAERQLVRLLSQMPFSVPEDKRIEGAIATCAATNTLANGCFNYDISDGSIGFRMSASFRESEIGEDLFSYMIDFSCTAVDEFNDKLWGVSKGFLSISDFLKSI